MGENSNGGGRESFFASISPEEQKEIDQAKLGTKIQKAEEAAELDKIRQEIDPDQMVKKLDETRDNN